MTDQLTIDRRIVFHRHRSSKKITPCKVSETIEEFMKDPAVNIAKAKATFSGRQSPRRTDQALHI